MKTIGIIAEYNPFHNGHLYQIEKLRSETQADYVIAAMSGDLSKGESLPSMTNIPEPKWHYSQEWTWFLRFLSALPPEAQRILPPAAQPCLIIWAW